MIKSMTGFGQSEGTVGNARIMVDVRTVNHRFFSPSIKLPGGLARWETDVREAARRVVSRGHLTITVRSERLAEAPIAIDEDRFGAVCSQLKTLAERNFLAGGVDLADVLRMPGVVAVPVDDGETGNAEQLLAVITSALDALNRSRVDEGAHLAIVLLERLDQVSAGIERLAARAPERVLTSRDRLRASLRDLMDGVSLDETRLAQEIAILAERIDVAEELDRFRAHMAAFRSTLTGSGGEPIGKRLGFLLQEMLREVNTTGSKAADAPMLHEVVGLKEELERIREQVENLE